MKSRKMFLKSYLFLELGCLSQSCKAVLSPVLLNLMSLAYIGDILHKVLCELQLWE